MDIDPSTTKYLISARLSTDGIVEKPDIVGAIFGQTEGLLGDELDLRDLQKSGRIGRIEVEVSSSKGKSEGVVYVPSSLDQVETAILASALETIDRVGPCKARITIEKIEDVRVSKRNKIVERAKELLNELMKASKTSGGDLTDSVRQSFQMEEVVHYGKERLPAGPNIEDSDAIIVVEGRSDVLNLLKYGIKNTIAVEGTNVPQTIIDLAKEKVVTAFVDGDRGGELILRELLQVAEIDFIARAPAAQEVEELTQKQIVKCLRNKVPADQFAEMFNMNAPLPRNGEKQGRMDEMRGDRGDRGRRDGRDDERRGREPEEARGTGPAAAASAASPEALPGPDPLQGRARGPEQHLEGEAAERGGPRPQGSACQQARGHPQGGVGGRQGRRFGRHNNAARPRPRRGKEYHFGGRCQAGEHRQAPDERRDLDEGRPQLSAWA